MLEPHALDDKTLFIPYWMQLTNFMSYHGTHTHEFAPGVHLFLGEDMDTEPHGSNGSGKTSLACWALTWNLFGRLPVSKYKVDDVINWEPDVDICSVKIKYRAPGQHIIVYRSRNVKGHNEFWYEVDGNKFQASDDKETQRSLEKFLRIDWGLYNTTVLLNSRSPVANFYKASATERMNILDSFIECNVYRECAKLVSRDLSNLGSERQIKEAELSVYVKQVETNQQQLRNLRTNMQIENDRVKQMQDQADKDIHGLELEIMKLKDQMRAGESWDIPSLQKQLSECSANTSGWTKEVGRLEYQLKAIPTNINTSGICPTCAQPVTAEHIAHLQNTAKSLGEELALAKRNLVMWQQQYDSINKQYTEAQQWPHKRRAIEQHIEAKKLQAFAMKDGINNSLIAQYTNQICQIESVIEAHDYEINACRIKIAELDQQIGQRKIAYEGFSKEIRFMLVDDIREIMAFYANRDLQLLGKPEQTLEFTSNKESGADTFDIQLMYADDRHGLPSQGQEYRVSAATTFGLIKTVHHYRPHRLGFLLVDDPVGELDDPGCRDLGGLLFDLTRHLPLILVTAPRVSVDIGDFPKTVVRYERGRSYVT